MSSSFGVTNHNAYTIITKEYREYGIFFRSPIQKVYYDTYCNNPLSAYAFANRVVKSNIYALYQMLIGNGKILKQLPDMVDRVDWAGFEANKLCFPIYFSRNCRTLKCILNDPEGIENNILSVSSYGFEEHWETVSGGCKLERTKVKLKSGKTIRRKRSNSYHYTFAHVIKELIATGNIHEQ